MNLQQLRYFRTIAEYEHYTKAAEVLSAHQSSLSHAVQSMERKLGVNLFTRTGRNVILSQYGKMFLPHVVKALDELEEGVAELRRATDPDTGVVAIASFPSLAGFVPDILVRYISEVNRVGVQFHTSQETYRVLREQLLNGDVNLAFASDIDDPCIGMTLIGEQRFVLLVPQGHRFAERVSVNPHELDGEDLIAYSKGSQIRYRFDAYFKREGIRPRIKAETAQDVMTYSLVAAGRGVAVMPCPLGSVPCCIKLVPFEGIEKRKLYLLWNKEVNMPPAVTQFRDFIIDQGLVFDEYRLRNNIQ